MPLTIASNVVQKLAIFFESRSFAILDKLLDLYRLKCDGLTALVVAIVLVLL